MNTCKMNDKETLTDLLSAEKFASAAYNTYCLEAATPSVRSTFCSLLQDEHRIAEEVFNEMNTRGYYSVEKAEQQKITAARSQFEQNATV